MSTYLIYVLVLSATLLLLQGLRNEFDETLRRVGRHWMPFAVFLLLCFAAAGGVLPNLGIPHLFRDDPDLKGLGQALNSSVFWTQFGITALLFAIWTYIYRFEALERDSLMVQRGRRRNARSFVLTYGLPMTLYIVGAAALPLNGPFFHYIDAIKGVLGVLFGILAFIFLIRLTRLMVRKVHQAGGLAQWHKVTKLLDRIQFFMVGPPSSPTSSRISHELSPRKRIRELRHQWREIDQPTHRMSPGTITRRSDVVRAFGFLTLMWAMIMSVSFLKVIQAGVSIVLILAWVLLILFTLGFLRPFARFWMIVMFAVALAASPKPDYRHAFPGLEGYYESPVPVVRNTASGQIEPSASLLQPIAALDRWRKGVGQDCSNLIILATSGGAYRSAYWTAAVLDELEHLASQGSQFKKLSNCIRLVTGASGGMVGAAYYVAMKNEVAPGKNGNRLQIGSVVGRLNQDTKCARTQLTSAKSECNESGAHYPTFFPYSRDSLTPVAHQLIQKDIHLFSLRSGPSLLDRGRVLEDQWLTLNHPFSWLQAAEADGDIPSLLVTPLAFWSEDAGAGIKESFAMPLAISNLDTRSLSGPDGRQVLSLFELFPNATSEFRIKTAIRMNATFPYVSPAVALPTVPPVRVVDAGYYENYGIAAAASWLFGAKDTGRSESPLEWLRSEGLGVIVIQIRAYPFAAAAAAKDRTCPEFDSDGKKNEHAAQIKDRAPGGKPKQTEDRESSAFHSMTSPLEAIVAVRDSGMNIRNDQQLALLDGRVSGVAVKTVAFENTRDVGMSWYLIPNEVDCLQEEVKSEFNRGQWSLLSCLANGGGASDCQSGNI